MPPARLRGFLSYSVVDRHVAAAVKVALAELGVDAFMAHEDVQVSQQWRDRILSELNVMDVFLPLLSAAFRSSDWTAQEVGVAIGRPEVLIIPTSVDGTVPYGFIGAIQGRKLPNPIAADFFREAIASRFPRVVVGSLIEALAGAGSWRGAEALFYPLLPYLATLTPDEAVALAKASTENAQIWDAALCRTAYLPDFIAKNKHHLPKGVLGPLQFQIDNASWYIPTPEPQPRAEDRPSP